MEPGGRLSVARRVSVRCRDVPAPAVRGVAENLANRAVSAKALLLGRLVGDLKEVRDRQRREDGGEEAGQAGREEDPDGEAGDDPEAEAVGADEQIADRL